MKSRKKVLIVMLVVCGVSVSYVWAQCATTGSCSSTAVKTCTTAAVKPVKAGQGCPFEAAGIKLTAVQQKAVMAILAKTHKDIAAVLTPDQKPKFSKVTLGGLLLGQKTCGSDCTTPSCAGQEKACGPNCTKPCCTSAQAVEQTTCPVMKGNPINKSVFTVYQGKKVYFCCSGCDDVFNKDPEKFVKALPQFQN